jgi:hypothetical protein
MHIIFLWKNCRAICFKEIKNMSTLLTRNVLVILLTHLKKNMKNLFKFITGPISDLFSSKNNVPKVTHMSISDGAQMARDSSVYHARVNNQQCFYNICD